MTPASWGLVGKSREIAEAEYYYDGADLEYKLADIRLEGADLKRAIASIDYRYDLLDEYALERKYCDIEYENKDIDEYAYKSRCLSIDKAYIKISDDDATLQQLVLDLKHKKITQKEYDVGLLDLRLKQNEIKQHDYDREVASLKNEPYVNVISMGIDNSSEGYFELDWNEAFVKMLYEDGLTGVSDEDVVNKWFNRVCKTVLIQEGADMDYGMQQPFTRQERPDVEYRRERKNKTSKNDGRDSTTN